jgi:hypothetical protein
MRVVVSGFDGKKSFIELAKLFSSDKASGFLAFILLFG